MNLRHLSVKALGEACPGLPARRRPVSSRAPRRAAYMRNFRPISHTQKHFNLLQRNQASIIMDSQEWTGLRDIYLPPPATDLAEDQSGSSGSIRNTGPTPRGSGPDAAG
jgi:hypothetical protein